MPVYRVIARGSTAAALPPLGKAIMSQRKELIERLRQQREQGDAPRLIRAWIDLAAGRGVRLLSLDGSTATGRLSQLVEMPADEADRMRREVTVVEVELLPGFNVHPPVSPTPEKPPLPPGLKPRDLWHLRAIGLTDARRKGFTGTGVGVTIAELGAGMDETHPELRGKIAAAVEFERTTGAAKPLARSADTVDGYGTHVAGLICGTNVGVAPGARLVNALMLPRGQGTLTDFITAMNWVADQPDVQVAVIAAGIRGELPELNAVLNSLVSVGILPVVAVGNEGEGQTRSPGNSPAGLSVGASTRKGKVAAFSGSGMAVADKKRGRVPHVAAPGEDVVSCYMGDGYRAMSGTSMAVPIVAGVAALILERRPKLTVAQLKKAIFSTCKALDEPAERQGHGLVQVKAAL